MPAHKNNHHHQRHRISTSHRDADRLHRQDGLQQHAYKQDGLMRFFWPTDLQRSWGSSDLVPGVIVGWRNSALDLFAVAVLESVEPRNVETALRLGTLFRNAPHPVSRIYELCGQSSMQVLGVCNWPTATSAPDAISSPPSADATASISGLDPAWVRITVAGPPGSRIPPHVTCPHALSVQVILLDRPHPGRMQYFSLDPVLLALGDKDEVAPGASASASLAAAASPAPDKTTDNPGAAAGTWATWRAGRAGGSPDVEDEHDERRRREQKARLVEKLRSHSVVRREPSAKERALGRIVNQVNWAWELERLVRQNAHLINAAPTTSRATRQKRSLSVSERVVESAATARDLATFWAWEIAALYALPVLRRSFVLGLMCHRVAAEALLRVLEWRGGFGGAGAGGAADAAGRRNQGRRALKDVSATAQQVEVRLQQFCYWPMQYAMLRQRKNDWESVTTSHPDYIRFYNSLWLVANDVIIGIALGSYIIDNADWVAMQVNDLLTVYTVEALQRSISWLMGWPAGLKLNNELARFLGDLFLWVIEYWSIGCIETLRPAWPHIIWFIGFSSFAGASMPIALFSDLLSFLTIHIYSFYLASARIFHWQLTILISLFHLFRGKKHNVLRNRIDSCDYDLDQLLVGTILFTLLFFLLPTVVVFYLNFAVARMIIISLKAVFDTLLSCLNHFPLFALMLRIKDPRRLPGGIRFELRDTHDDRLAVNANEPPTSVIYLKPIPLTFRAMFHQYFQMASRIRKHYLSPRVLFCLLTGRFVPPIDRRNLYSLQYSMLPARRAGIVEMWEALSTLFLAPGGTSGTGGTGAGALRMGFASFGIPAAPPTTAATKRMRFMMGAAGPGPGPGGPALGVGGAGSARGWG